MWTNGIRHRGVSPLSFDLASLADRRAAGYDAFMVLDLVEDGGMSSKVKDLYEHDGESFVWVLLFDMRRGSLWRIHL